MTSVRMLQYHRSHCV